MQQWLLQLLLSCGTLSTLIVCRKGPDLYSAVAAAEPGTFSPFREVLCCCLSMTACLSVHEGGFVVVAEAKHKVSFQKRKAFLKEFASEYLGKKQELKPEEAVEGPGETEEKAKAMETEADAAAEQPKEETEAGEPAANGAIATPMDEDAKEPAGEHAAEAAAPDVIHLRLVMSHIPQEAEVHGSMT